MREVTLEEFEALQGEYWSLVATLDCAKQFVERYYGPHARYMYIDTSDGEIINVTVLDSFNHQVQYNLSLPAFDGLKEYDDYVNDVWQMVPLDHLLPYDEQPDSAAIDIEEFVQRYWDIYLPHSQELFDLTSEPQFPRIFIEEK